MTNLLLQLQSKKYAKGLLSLGILEPGEDCVVLLGCYTLETLAVWVACMLLGIAVAVGLRFTVELLLPYFGLPMFMDFNIIL